MELFEYIKKSYKTPNPFVVKSLGGSEELVEYLRKTPWNTNLNVVGSFSSSGGDQGEVWFTGTITECNPEQSFSLELLPTSVADYEALYNDGDNYKVWLNGKEMTRSSNPAQWFIGENYNDGIQFEVFKYMGEGGFATELNLPPSYCKTGDYSITVAHK